MQSPLVSVPGMLARVSVPSSFPAACHVLQEFCYEWAETCEVPTSVYLGDDIDCEGTCDDTTCCRPGKTGRGWDPHQWAPLCDAMKTADAVGLFEAPPHCTAGWVLGMGTMLSQEQVQ